MAIQDEQKRKAEMADLKKRLKVVEDWMKQKKLQQISNPLDKTSQAIIKLIP